MEDKFKTFHKWFALTALVMPSLVLAQDESDDEEEAEGVFEEVVVVGQSGLRDGSKVAASNKRLDSYTG